ncbi:Heterokaryon incompatibility protein (HET) domain containing protein [Rhypophila decipiens]
MRLVDAKHFQLVEVAEAKEPYAILSHRWETDERREKQAGFQKIEHACKQALEDGIGFVWVDTCCIDKASSAELSEAINSMFNRYQRAIVCYSYLSDAEDFDSTFYESKWFGRGWTLQELLAPAKVQFFSRNWTTLGEKSDLAPVLSNITGIDSLILRGETPLQQVSVAKRMSWASRRETTRPEDTAYCLMGIFDVNMPMLYGEGSKAFIRLQEEILRDSEDQSLFAWTASEESAKQAPYRGLFALSPAEFASSFDVDSFPRLSAFQTPMTPINRGIPFTTEPIYLASHTFPIKFDRRLRMGLNCHRWHGDESQIIGIELISRGGDQYLRACPDRLFESRTSGSTVTVYVAKHAARDKIEPVPNAERQHAFFFRDLPPTIRTTYVSGSMVEHFLPDQSILVRSNRTDEEKAALKIHTPTGWTNEAIFLFLWAERIESIQSYKVLFDVGLTPKDGRSFFIAQAKKPSTLFDERVISFGTGKPSIAFSIEPTVVRGFDMFAIKVEVRQPRTNFERNKVARWGGSSGSTSRVESV